MLVLKPKLRFFFALFYDQPYSWSFCFLPHSISDFNQDLSFVCKYCFYFCSYGRTDSNQSIYSRLINFNGKRCLKKRTQCFFYDMAHLIFCRFLPFDDENIASLYRKIQSGVYEKPPWLSQVCTLSVPNPF